MTIVQSPSTRAMRPGLALALLAGAGIAAYLGARAWLRPGPLEAAGRAYAQGDWQAAEKQARAWLKDHAADPIATRLVARSAARQGLDDSALIHYRLIDETLVEPEDRAL